MFKVGDKVCHPVGAGNGVVEQVISFVTTKPYVHTKFENGKYMSFWADGRLSENDILPALYHGHMEEGTAKITFEPKKEPVYEWQWEYVSYKAGNAPYIGITDFYTSEKEMIDMWAETWRKDFIRIERSKRERKQ